MVGGMKLRLLLLLSVGVSRLFAAESSTLNADLASAFVKLALKGIDQEYPNKPGEVLRGPEDLLSPRAMHSAFYGCYDWHSSVHGHWLLVRLLRRKYPKAEFTEAEDGAIAISILQREGVDAKPQSRGRRPVRRA